MYYVAHSNSYRGFSYNEGEAILFLHCAERPISGPESFGATFARLPCNKKVAKAHLSAFLTVPSHEMNHLRGVLFLAFALLIVQVLAEEGRERQEFGNFGSLSTDANVASDVRAVPLRTSNVESLAAGNSRNAEYTVSSTDEASTRNYFAQDSVFQSYACSAQYKCSD